MIDFNLYNETFTGRTKVLARCSHCASEMHSSGDCAYAPWLHHHKQRPIGCLSTVQQMVSNPPGWGLSTCIWSQSSQYLPSATGLGSFLPSHLSHLLHYLTNIRNHSSTGPRTHSWCPFVTPTIAIICSPSSTIPATQISKENTRSGVYLYVWALPRHMETSGKRINMLSPPLRATQRPCKRYINMDWMLLVSHINPRYPVPTKDPPVHVLHEDDCEG